MNDSVIVKLKNKYQKSVTGKEFIHPETETDAVLYKGKPITEHIHPRIILSEDEFDALKEKNALIDGIDYLVYENE